MKVKDPVFIIGCPRSGTTLLFTILRSSPELWSSYNEAHYLWEKFLLDPRDPMYSMHLDENDFSEGDREYLEEKMHKRTFNSEWYARINRMVFFNNALKPIMRPLFKVYSHLIKFYKSLFLKDYRVMDKTPPNTYRVSYLKKAFPDAKFIYITRDGITNISSLIEGWKSEGRFNFGFRKFYDYNKDINIKGYEGSVWKFTNPPGWEAYMNSSLEEVSAFQWQSAHKYALESFERMDPADWRQVKYEDLVAEPERVIKEMVEFTGIEYSGKLREYAEKPPVVSTSSKPNPKKWMKNKELLKNIVPMIEEMQTKLGYQIPEELKSTTDSLSSEASLDRSLAKDIESKTVSK